MNVASSDNLFLADEAVFCGESTYFESVFRVLLGVFRYFLEFD